MMLLDLPGLTDSESQLVKRLWAQLEVKRTRNLLRDEIYDGRRAITQIGTIIPPTYYRLGIVLGWCAKAVDIPARRVNLNQFVWPDGDLNSLGMTESWAGNNMRARISSAVVSSLIHGTSFLVNTLGDPQQDEPLGLIHVKDAMSATGTLNPRVRDRLENLLSVTEWRPSGETGGPKKLVLYQRNLTITADYDEEKNAWTVDRFKHPWGMPAEPLIYRPRVGRPFGSSRISRPLMATQDSALRALIRMEGHMDVYSWPELYLLGADATIFKNADGTPKADWQVMLGRIKGIPDDEQAQVPRADVKQFPASSPEPHLAQLNALAKMFAREASLPDTSVAITDVSNPTSGESYDASQHELISEVEGAIDDWSPSIARAQIRALAMQNDQRTIPKEWATIWPKFRNPRYMSRAAEADAGMKQLTAVPWLAETEVGLELLGLDSQQIARAMAERDVARATSDGALLAAALDRQTTPTLPTTPVP